MVRCPIHGTPANTKLSFANTKFNKFGKVEACYCSLCNNEYIDVAGIKPGKFGRTKSNVSIINVHKYIFFPEKLNVLLKKELKVLEREKNLVNINDFSSKDYKIYQIPSKFDKDENQFYITVGSYVNCFQYIKKFEISINISDDALEQLQENEEEFEYAMKFYQDKEEISELLNFNDLKQNNKIAIAYNSANIQYNPYQYLPWLYMFNEGYNSILISDEVGLGKTIEAGILIAEALHENSDYKILIVCPAFLRNKWKTELYEKFYITSYIYGEQEIESNIVVLPLSRLKKFNDENELNYDMVIVDEVHYFKNSNSSRYLHLKNLLEKNSPERKVFMSATPINNSGSDYYSVRALLGNEIIKTSTTKKQAYINIPKRTVKEIYVDLNNIEQELYNVTDALDPFSGTIYRHIGSSCLYALVKYASKYTSNESDVKAELRSSLEELLDDDFDESREIESIRDQISQFKLDGIDSKLTLLLHTIDNIEDKKIIIFSHYIETVKYLKSELSSKYNCEYIYGNNFSNQTVYTNKRNRFIDAKIWFNSQDLSKKTILICSDSCREGVDLDAASCLINYDLPFNPSILEQRIGRIDRMCQKNDMKIFNFHVNNTYDDRLHMILSTKLFIINYFSEYGIGNPLSIVENGPSPFDKFISYFKKNDHFEMTNDDFYVIRKILNKIEVKTKKDISQTEILSLLTSNKDKIINLFDEKEFSSLTDEQLQLQKDYLDEILNFPKQKTGKITIDTITKKKIATLINEKPSLKIKLANLIINYETKLKLVEDTGNPMIIDENDIRSSMNFSSSTNTSANFISTELIEILKKQGVEIHDN